MRDYIVNGVPLRDPQGKWFIDYTRSSLHGNSSRRISTENLYGGHGLQTPAPSFFGPGSETIVLNVIGDTEAEYVQNFRALQGLLLAESLSVQSAPQRTALTTPTARRGASFSGTISRTATMRVVGSLAVERINSTTSRVTFTLENIGAFWKSITSYSIPDFAMADSLSSVLLGAMAGDSNAPLTETYLRVRGPIAAGGHIVIRDGDNDWRSIRVDFPTAIDSTRTILFDFEGMRVFNVTNANGDNWVFSGLSLASQVRISGEGSFFFSPIDPQNTFPTEVFVYSTKITSSGMVGSTASFRGKRSYIS